MDKCRYIGKDKHGNMNARCGYLAQPDSAYCPRHTFLHNVTEKQRADKDANKEAAKLAGVMGGSQPPTRKALLERGYEFRGSGPCSGCAAHVEWWKTPSAKMAPYDPMPHLESFAKSHFATCTHRAEFRRAS